MSSPRFHPGARVGSHSIRKFLGNGPLGERYEVFYGSTNHLHCLTVPPEGLDEALRTLHGLVLSLLT